MGKETKVVAFLRKLGKSEFSNYKEFVSFYEKCEEKETKEILVHLDEFGFRGFYYSCLLKVKYKFTLEMSFQCMEQALEIGYACRKVVPAKLSSSIPNKIKKMETIFKKNLMIPLSKNKGLKKFFDMTNYQKKYFLENFNRNNYYDDSKNISFETHKNLSFNGIHDDDNSYYAELIYGKKGVKCLRENEIERLFNNLPTDIIVKLFNNLPTEVRDKILAKA